MRWMWPFTAQISSSVNKAEQHGLGEQPGLFKENHGNKLEKKLPFFLPEYAKSLSSAMGELGTGSW